MTDIKEYNQMVSNWDFNTDEYLEFLRLLTDRNKYILSQKYETDYFLRYQPYFSYIFEKK